MRRIVLFLTLPLLALSCQYQGEKITNPSGQPLDAWFPCVVVQSPGGTPFPLQMAAVERLQRAGRMTWIRLNAYPDGSSLPYYIQSKSMGLKIFSIIHLKDLDGLGWHEAFDHLYSTYPDSDVWEIAGEISNPDPYVNPKTTTPESYIPRLIELNEYVRDRYPNVRLTSAPTLGSSGGPAELERFIELGLLEIPGIIVPVNVYTNETLDQYAVVFNRYRARMYGHPVWVTETGARDPDLQISWVRDMYPKIRRTLNPEMVCYYELWGGDRSRSASGDNGFGMLDGLEDGPYIERPLFKALTASEAR